MVLLFVCCTAWCNVVLSCLSEFKKGLVFLFLFNVQIQRTSLPVFGFFLLCSTVVFSSVHFYTEPFLSLKVGTILASGP